VWLVARAGSGGGGGGGGVDMGVGVGVGVEVGVSATMGVYEWAGCRSRSRLLGEFDLVQGSLY
jgi:hypothetical protein